MFKNRFKLLFTVILLVLLLNNSLFPGEMKQYYPKIPTAEDEARFFERLKQYSNTTSPELPVQRGRYELGRTWYDYACNQQMGRTMAHAFETGDDGIHFVFMKILPQGSERYVTYDYFDLGLGFFFGNMSVDQSLGRSGWGRVVNGRNDEALIAFHSNIVGGIHLYWGDNYTFYQSVSIIDAGFPGIAREGDVVVFMGNLNSPPYWDTLLVSSDYMQSWTDHNNPLTVNGGGEAWPSINPSNSMEFSYIYTSDISPNAPEGGTRLTTTTDLGFTFTSRPIQGDHKIFPGNRKYIIENFGQWNGFYTQDGVYHAVAGAVQGIRDTATSALIDLFPIIYWNNRDTTLIEITSDAADTPSDTSTMNGLIDFRPGNGLGNAYPQLSEGPNGDLIAIWQQWEADSAGGLVTVIPSGGNEVFMTDIWGTYSPDGGLSWSEPFFVAGTPLQSDVFPNITKDFVYNATGDSIILDIMYLWDTAPGVSLFSGGNDPSECIWFYKRVAIAFSDIVEIDESRQQTIPAQLTLFQNYPNPFNPLTKIKYRLKRTAPVKLEVFNVAGEKVATLVEGKKTAGNHEVTFDGVNLPSGVYFYRLSAGGFSQTKKMILMR